MPADHPMPSTGPIPGIDARANGDPGANSGDGPPKARGWRALLLDVRPLTESRAFTRLFVGNTIAGIGAQMTILAVGLQVYHLTASTFAVAMVGVVALVPMVVAGLYGGMLVDAFDRRRVMLTAAIVAWTATIGIAVLAWSGAEVVWPLLVLTALNASAVTVESAGRQAVQPRLVRRELLPAASALYGVTYGLFVTIGPALGGVLVATVGFAWTYTVDVLLFVAAFAGIATLPSLKPEGATHPPGLKSIREGLAFLRRSPNIRMSFIVDLVAMTFGRPHALFPAVGATLLGGGAITVGALTAAGAVGAILLSVFSGPLGRVRRQGRAVSLAIIVHGACIAAMGVVFAVVMVTGSTESAPISGDEVFDASAVNWIALSLAVLFMAGSGAADNVSAIFRTTILQSAAPDNMRGRLQGIFVIVVTGGPRLGDLYVGTVALVAALWVPPLLGGLLIMSILGALMRWQRSFQTYDARTPVG